MGDLTATLILLVVLLGSAALLSFAVILEQMGVAGCSSAPSACNYLATRSHSSRRSWWVPLTGVLLIVIAFAIASILVDVALA